jgi:hypothetical protein
MYRRLASCPLSPPHSFSDSLSSSRFLCCHYFRCVHTITFTFDILGLSLVEYSTPECIEIKSRPLEYESPFLLYLFSPLINSDLPYELTGVTSVSLYPSQFQSSTPGPTLARHLWPLGRSYRPKHVTPGNADVSMTILLPAAFVPLPMVISSPDRGSLIPICASLIHGLCREANSSRPHRPEGPVFDFIHRSLVCFPPCYDGFRSIP